MAPAIERYEKQWLPLLAKHKRLKGLAAPLDVAWVWFMHALAPSKYAADVQRITGVPAVSIQADSPQHCTPDAMRQAEHLWEEEYGAGTFRAPGLQKGDAESGAAYEQRSSYDLIAAAARQQVFLYQVSFPHWRTSWFIQRCVQRYFGFLMLRRNHRTAFLVPTYDIDLVWHAHMAGHARYRSEVLRLTGSDFNHDDSVNDRTPGEKLENNYLLTTELWKQTFKQEYVFEGGMYRGQLSPDFLREFSRSSKGRQEGCELEHPAQPLKISICPVSLETYDDDCVQSIDIESQGRVCGVMYKRTPLNRSGHPACVLVCDAQGALRAVSRLLSRDHLPAREPEMAEASIPLYENREAASLPFLIQSCQPDGSSQDWAILQCLHSTTAFQPHLYRLGPEFFQQKTGNPTGTSPALSYCGRAESISHSLGLIPGTKAGSIKSERGHARMTKGKLRERLKGFLRQLYPQRSTSEETLIWEILTSSSLAVDSCMNGYCSLAALGTMQIIYNYK